MSKIDEIDVLRKALHNHNHNLKKAETLVELFLEENNLTERDMIDGAFYLAQRSYYRRIIVEAEEQLKTMHLEGDDV